MSHLSNAVRFGAVASLAALAGACLDWRELSRQYPRAEDAATNGAPSLRDQGGEVQAPRDAGQDLARDTDGPLADAPRPACSWEGDFAFSSPVLLAELSSPEDDVDPFVSADGLTLYFSSKRRDPNQADVYRADRPDTLSPFGAPVPVLASEANETKLVLSADGLVAYVSAAWGDGGDDLYRAQRADRAREFTREDFSALDLFNTPLLEFDPFITQDDRNFYFTVADSVNKTWRIMHALQTSPGVFAQPELVSGLSDPDAKAEDNPSLTADQRLMVFASASVRKDIWYARRADGPAAFGNPAILPGVNVNTDWRDTEPFVSADGCELYFSSNRTGGPGKLDLYYARYRRLDP